MRRRGHRFIRIAKWGQPSGGWPLNGATAAPYPLGLEFVSPDPEILGGVACFTGTRVSVSLLFEYLKSGATINYFLSHFPTVERGQVLAVLDAAKHNLSSEQVRRAVQDEAAP